MEYNSEIMNHPFYSLLKDHEHKYLNEIKNDIFDIELKGDLNEHQYYIHYVGFSYVYLSKWIAQLFLANDLIMNFDYSSYNNYSRFDHLYYNLENYILRYQSTKDRILQLINCVFHLCNPDNLVNEKVILSNILVSNSGITNIYNKMKSLKSFEKERNEIVHRHSLLTKEMKRLEIYYSKQDIQSSSKTYRANELKQEIKRISKEINNSNSILLVEVVKLLTALQIVYEKIEKRILLTTAST